VCGICGGPSKDHTNEASGENNRNNAIAMNSVHVNIDEEVLKGFEDPNICQICFDNVLTSTNTIKLSCGHEFCGTCVTSYLKISINNGKVCVVI
jgi:hypothetical protein